MLLMRVMSGLITVETVGFGSLSPDGSGSSEEGPELRPRVDRPAIKCTQSSPTSSWHPYKTQSLYFYGWLKRPKLLCLGINKRISWIYINNSSTCSHCVCAYVVLMEEFTRKMKMLSSSTQPSSCGMNIMNFSNFQQK